MNKCTNCGAEFEGEVCPECGTATAVAEEAPVEAVAPEAAEPVATEAAEEPAISSAEEAAIVPPPRERGQVIHI